jgi:hypothetical protein
MDRLTDAERTALLNKWARQMFAAEFPRLPGRCREAVWNKCEEELKGETP